MDWPRTLHICNTGSRITLHSNKPIRFFVRGHMTKICIKFSPSIVTVHGLNSWVKLLHCYSAWIKNLGLNLMHHLFNYLQFNFSNGHLILTSCYNRNNQLLNTFGYSKPSCRVENQALVSLSLVFNPALGFRITKGI